MTLLSALAVATAGCTHQPPAQVSAELNVIQLASQMGYKTPEVVDGKTLFCANEEVTGSIVPKFACIDSEQVVAKARAQGELIKAVQSSVPVASGVGNPKN
jgi:hypothetical protein